MMFNYSKYVIINTVKSVAQSLLNNWCFYYFEQRRSARH